MSKSSKKNYEENKNNNNKNKQKKVKEYPNNFSNNIIEQKTETEVKKNS